MRTAAVQQPDEIYFAFLDALRESGAVNMFGAAPVLQEEYPELTARQARDVWIRWAQSFGARHRLTS